MHTKQLATLAALLLVAAGLPLVAQSRPNVKPPPHIPSSRATAQTSHALRCLDADGKTPCTAAQIQTLNQGLATALQSDPALAGVRSLSLDSSSGVLRCTQNSGATCTAAQLQAVQEYAAKKKSKGGGCLCVMRSFDKASV